MSNETLITADGLEKLKKELTNLNRFVVSPFLNELKKQSL